MSRTEKKRKAEDSNGIRKRRKAQGPPGPSSTTRLAGTIVAGDALKWKPVELPDRLEDAEGFFGLEEIDDVEVVRDGVDKQVRFRTHAAPSGDADEIKEDRNDITQDAKSTLASGDNEEEWSGFDDREQAGLVFGTPGATNGAALEKPYIKSQGIKANEKAKAKVKAHQTLAELENELSYAVLPAASEEEDTDISAWSSLGLSSHLLGAISGLGFVRPTDIQAAAIPQITEGHDVIGKAVTGSGKTLAFGIPILERWLDGTSRRHSKESSKEKIPIALVLSPTRELAHQISKHLSDLTTGLTEKPRIATVTGGLSVLKQQRQLADADIIVGTPGRLWEVISDSSDFITRLKQIQFLVVDEADRLLSEGHFQDLEQILDALDRRTTAEEDSGAETTNDSNDVRQTLVFSATFHKGLQQKLAGKARNMGGDLMTNAQSMEYLLKKLSFRETRPKFIDVNPTSQMAEGLREALLECGAMEKDIYLYSLLLQHPQAKVLVFANSISSVRRLVPLLQNLNLAAIALHSTMPQKARLRSIEKFTAQRAILIATDVAARGLDIKGIDLIIHYHVPRTADMYVHRSGRTARADKVGKSIMLCSPDEVSGVTRLVAKVHSDYELESIQMDRQIVTRLQPRLALSKKITDASMAKEKIGTRDDWLRNAAEELGADYDSEEFAAQGAQNSRGRGGGKSKKQQKDANTVSKDDIRRMKAQLKEMLGKRVNLGTSERYLAGGRVDVDALLRDNGDQAFLGG